jgi:hypothetical protein
METAAAIITATAQEQIKTGIIYSVIAILEVWFHYRYHCCTRLKSQKQVL